MAIHAGTSVAVYHVSTFSNQVDSAPLPLYTIDSDFNSINSFCSWSPNKTGNSKLVVLDGDRVVISNVSDGSQIEHSFSAAPSAVEWVCDLNCSENQKNTLLAVATGNSVDIYEVQTWKVVCATKNITEAEDSNEISESIYLILSTATNTTTAAAVDDDDDDDDVLGGIFCFYFELTHLHLSVCVCAPFFVCF